MRTPLSRSVFCELSLVPLADMLTNTVGIVLFILIFTVLTAGGVVVAKRLPMERSTDKTPILVVCADGRLFPRSEDLLDRFLEPLGKPARWPIDRWLDSFKARTLEDDYFLITGQVTEAIVTRHLTVVFTPRSESGEPIARARQEDSDYRRLLHDHPATDWFVFFLVRPDSLDAFVAARDVASQLGYSVGWNPLGPDDPLRISLTGAGREPTEI